VLNIHFCTIVFCEKPRKGISSCCVSFYIHCMMVDDFTTISSPITSYKTDLPKVQLSFYEWSYFNDVLIRFTVTICLFMNEIIWMKYWSILLWRAIKLLLSIAFYLQVNYVKPKCSQKETFPCYLFNTPFRKNQKPYNSYR
jgi:hypothetical protein